MAGEVNAQKAELADEILQNPVYGTRGEAQAVLDARKAGGERREMKIEEVSGD